MNKVGYNANSGYAMKEKNTTPSNILTEYKLNFFNILKKRALQLNVYYNEKFEKFVHTKWIPVD